MLPRVGRVSGLLFNRRNKVKKTKPDGVSLSREQADMLAKRVQDDVKESEAQLESIIKQSESIILQKLFVEKALQNQRAILARLTQQ